MFYDGIVKNSGQVEGMLIRFFVFFPSNLFLIKLKHHTVQLNVKTKRERNVKNSDTERERDRFLFLLFDTALVEPIKLFSMMGLMN